MQAGGAKFDFAIAGCDGSTHQRNFREDNLLGFEPKIRSPKSKSKEEENQSQIQIIMYFGLERVFSWHDKIVQLDFSDD